MTVDETLATVPDFWRVFDWSTDYRDLFDLLIAGNRVPCLAPYNHGGAVSNIWDICKAWYDDYSGFDFGARGISYTRSYPHNDHSFEAFEKLCKEGNIVFLRPSTALAAELKQLREFVGAMNFVSGDEWVIQQDAERKFTVYGDGDLPVLATGTDPADAYRKMVDNSR